MNTLGYVARQFQRPKRIRSPSSSPTLSAIGPAPVVVEQILLVRVVLLLWDRLQLAWSSLLALRSTQERTPPSRPAPARVPKTLVLDLDETLIHSTSRPMQPTGGFFGFGHTTNPGQMVEVVLGGQTMLYHVYKRPFVDFFLRTVSGWYTLVIFTASVQEYADPVIDWLDAGRGILSHRFFRDSCTQLPNGVYTKDLSLVDPDLSRVCLIDNSPVSYSTHQANGIPIEGWTQDPHDEALLDLLPVLDSLRFTSDVRRVLGIRIPAQRNT